MSFKTQYNYVQEERFNSESPTLTIPGQSASIRELYARAMRGEPINHSKNLTYTGDEIIPNFDGMDPVDVDNYMAVMAQVRDQIKENHKLNEEQKAAKLQEAEHAMYLKWADKYAQKPTTMGAAQQPGQKAANDQETLGTQE